MHNEQTESAEPMNGKQPEPVESLPAMKEVKKQNRPKIPAAIVREVLTESGHRCAVCGESCPLEKAHIIPWCESKDHSAGNLICLCANCHQRADLERWGQKALRQYKDSPWVSRRFLADGKIKSPARVKLIIDMDLDDFDQKNERLLIFSIAAFLEISPQCVVIKNVEAGSVIVTLELPYEKAEKLLDGYNDRSEAITSILREMGIENIYSPAPDEGEIHVATLPMPRVRSENQDATKTEDDSLDSDVDIASIAGLLQGEESKAKRRDGTR